jgi:hypothetical protein
LVPTGDGGRLKAATLARATATGAGTVDGQHFRFRIQFLDLHGKGINGFTTDAAAAVGIFEGMGNLRALGVEVLELGTCFTP